MAIVQVVAGTMLIFRNTDWHGHRVMQIRFSQLVIAVQKQVVLLAVCACAAHGASSVWMVAADGWISVFRYHPQWRGRFGIADDLFGFRIASFFQSPITRSIASWNHPCQRYFILLRRSALLHYKRWRYQPQPGVCSAG